MFSKQSAYIKFGHKLSRFACLFVLFAVFTTYSKSSHACCWACPQSDCNSAEQDINDWHDQIEDDTKENFDDDLQVFERWMIEVLLYQEVMPAMAAMADQMSTLAVHYTQIIGAFLDAQVQLDTQRLLRKLTFEAHNDYRISDGVCVLGTNVKSLAATDIKLRHNSLALSRIAIDRQMGDLNTASAKSARSGYAARWKTFITTYCDVRDNNFQTGGTAFAPDFNTGLALACDHDGPGGSSDRGAEAHKRINRDIDYTRLIENKRTLEVDLTEDPSEPIGARQSLEYDKLGFITGAIPPGYFSSVLEDGDEEDVLSMSENLYGSRPLSRDIRDAVLETEVAKKLYLGLRSVAAKRNVAQATFNGIVALKSAGTGEDMSGATMHPSGSAIPLLEAHQTRRYMLAVMNELLPGDPATTAGNIFDLIGYSPSYFSQLELLAKRIYQNPDFYADLYDTPTNVKRKRVAMKAIELMLDRTIYESQLRREMSVSVLLSSKLRSAYRNADRGLEAGAN